MNRTYRRRRDSGSIGLLNVGALALLATLMLVGINVGNAYSKRDLVGDAAQMLAVPILMNQLARDPDDPHWQRTDDFVKELAQDGKLSSQIGETDITYEFGRINQHGKFVRVNKQDPDPGKTSEWFHAVAVEVSYPLVNIGNAFGLKFGTVRGRAIAQVSPNPPCCLAACDYNRNGEIDSDLLGDLLLGGLKIRGLLRGVFKVVEDVTEVTCSALCNTLTGLDALLRFDMRELDASLNCVLETVEFVLIDAFNWLFGDGAVTVHIEAEVTLG